MDVHVLRASPSLQKCLSRRTPLDAKLLNNVLEDVEKALVIARKKAVDMINAHHVQYLHEVHRQQELATEVSGISNELDELQDIINNTDKKGIRPQIEKWVRRFDIMLEVYEKEKAAAKLANGIRVIEDLLGSLDKIFEAGHILSAVECLGDIRERLASLSALHCKEQPESFEDLRLKFESKKQELCSYLEKLFSRFLYIESSTVCLNKAVIADSKVCQNGKADEESFDGLFTALFKMEIMDTVASSFTKELNSKILTPLLTQYFNNSTHERIILQEYVNDETGICSWVLSGSPITHELSSADHFSLQECTDILMSLFTFLEQSLHCRNKDVLQPLLSVMWDMVSNELCSVNWPSSVGDYYFLARFEQQMQHSGFAPSTDIRLSSFALQMVNKHLSIEEAETLGNVRSAVLSDEVLEHDSKTTPYNQWLSKPGTSISIAADQILQIVYRLTNDAALVAAKGQELSRANLQSSDAFNAAFSLSVGHAQKLLHLARQCILLFIVMRPAAFRSRLSSEPDFFSTFFDDCSFLTLEVKAILNNLAPIIPKKEIADFQVVLDVLHDLQQAVLARW